MQIVDYNMYINNEIDKESIKLSELYNQINMTKKLTPLDINKNYVDKTKKYIYLEEDDIFLNQDLYYFYDVIKMNFNSSCLLRYNFNEHAIKNAEFVKKTIKEKLLETNSVLVFDNDDEVIPHNNNNDNYIDIVVYYNNISKTTYEHLALNPKNNKIKISEILPLEIN